MLIDSHCHLEFTPELDGIVMRAKQSGVELMLDAGSNLDHLSEHIEICQKYQNIIYTAVGAHPHQALEFTDLTATDILRGTESEKVIAIGEAGLDYFYDFAPKEVQIALFEKNITAAQTSGLPLIIHNRNSDEDMIKILKNSYEKKEFKAIIHCYSSSFALAQVALEMGFYISASGIITFAKSQEIRDHFAQIPLDRLLVETDSPYLSPVPKRGIINEPSHIVFTAQKLADIKGVSFDEISKITTQNFKRLFGR